ncbi:hypothetical protein ORJ66_20715, partial [Pseudoalteromonas tunicata]|uniref:hypothetical protein n=1 Tax=Pseudoalteromonas tunicata TaxID=314281 RepID=UPI00273D1501
KRHNSENKWIRIQLLKWISFALLVTIPRLMLALALFLPFMNRLFHFEAPPIEYLVMMITAVSGILLLVASITTQSKQDKNL